MLYLSISAQSQTLPYKYKVLQKMVLANKYFMDKWPDPTVAIVTDKTDQVIYGQEQLITKV